MPPKKTDTVKPTKNGKVRRKHKKTRKAYPDEEYSSSESESDEEPSKKVYPINYNHASMPFY